MRGGTSCCGAGLAKRQVQPTATALHSTASSASSSSLRNPACSALTGVLNHLFVHDPTFARLQQQQAQAQQERSNGGAGSSAGGVAGMGGGGGAEKRGEGVGATVRRLAGEVLEVCRIRTFLLIIIQARKAGVEMEGWSALDLPARHGRAWKLGAARGAARASAQASPSHCLCLPAGHRGVCALRLACVPHPVLPGMSCCGLRRC